MYIQSLIQRLTIQMQTNSTIYMSKPRHLLTLLVPYANITSYPIALHKQQNYLAMNKVQIEYI